MALVNKKNSIQQDIKPHLITLTTLKLIIINSEMLLNEMK